MVRYSVRKVNEFGKITLHSKLRKNVRTGDKFSFEFNGTMIIVQKVIGEPDSNCAISEIDRTGKIALPKAFLQDLGVETGDDIVLYHTDNMFILQPLHTAQMERYNSRKMDTLGKISLCHELRYNLGVNKGDKISLQLIDSIIIIHRAEIEPDPSYATSKIDDLGAFVLPKEFRLKLGIKAEDEVILYHSGNMLIMKASGKNKCSHCPNEGSTLIAN